MRMGLSQNAHAQRGLKYRVAALLLLAAAVLASLGWTGGAWGQAKPVRIGILSFAPVADDPNLQTFLQLTRRKLSERGWIEGNNLTLEFRSANSDPMQFAAAAAALAALDVDVILAGSAPALRAAFSATHTIPIVASDYTTDPVAEGYVESYARPGGNVTGVFLDAPEFAGKWFELLKAIIPDLMTVVVLWDPGPGANHLQAVRSVANLLNIELQVLEVRKPADIDRTFATLREKPQAIVFLPSPMIYGHSERLARLTLMHRLPATSMATEFASAGGMIAYGPDTELADERIADILAKVLSGSNPGRIPVERPSRFKLIVNLKTAKALGITIPQSILLRADEVIR